MLRNVPAIMKNNITHIWEEQNCIEFSKHQNTVLTDKNIINDKIYLEMAKVWSKRSHCIRKKVGALLINGDQIISDGYNGTPNGFSNDCEDCNDSTYWYTCRNECYNKTCKVFLFFS